MSDDLDGYLLMQLRDAEFAHAYLEEAARTLAELSRQQEAMYALAVKRGAQIEALTHALHVEIDRANLAEHRLSIRPDHQHDDRGAA